MANVNPLAGIQDPVHTWRPRDIGANVLGCEWLRSDLLKWHSFDLVNAGPSGMHVERSAIGFFPVEFRDGAVAF